MTASEPSRLTGVQHSPGDPIGSHGTATTHPGAERPPVGVAPDLLAGGARRDQFPPRRRRGARPALLVIILLALAAGIGIGLSRPLEPATPTSALIVDTWTWGEGGHVITFTAGGAFVETNRDHPNERVTGRWTSADGGIACRFDNGYTATVTFVTPDELHISSADPAGASWDMAGHRQR
jgi:hypothetical protein